MVSTALDAGDELLRKVLKDVIHVPIRIPNKFDVLDFKIGLDGRREVFNLGYHQSSEFLDNLEILQRHNQAEDFVHQLGVHGLGQTEIREGSSSVNCKHATVTPSSSKPSYSPWHRISNQAPTQRTSGHTSCYGPVGPSTTVRRRG